jgi:microsomal dipeptidase-like Zn-dependent dipeptidase
VFTFLPDLNTPRRLETLADLLLARGHSEARVEKILGGNFARLFREVWKDPGEPRESAAVQRPCQKLVA